MDAAEALAAGLVTTVVPATETVGAALDLASRIAAMPPLAVREAKRLVRLAAERSLGEGLRAEREAFFGLFATADQREGMRAFIEKRSPVWTGH
jgi:enoyl-CoA hydratase